MMVEEKRERARVVSRGLCQQLVDKLEHLENDTVHIFGLAWKKLNMIHICQEIESWEVPNRLNLSCNKEPSILLSIHHIQFPSLKSLNLAYNKIVSIEVLPYLHAPFLNQLILKQNQITKIASLRKCSFPQLTKLSLNDNRIVEMSPLSQMQSSALRELVLEKGSANRPQGHDISWFLKMESIGMFEVLNLDGFHRIAQVEVRKQIVNKYPFVQI